jgi:EAL domain-containing protein (putative c-di-GMP-specific phosphodiesterase class I)
VENIIEGVAYPAMVFQPIVELQTGHTLGYEALSRFGSESPDVWFAEATRAGLGEELELKAIGRALERLSDLPADTFLAIDDLGAGYSSLQHVIALQPEIIKLDRGLIQVTDPAGNAMIQTLVTLGQLTGATLIAEGIEDTTVLGLVRELGVPLGQGFHLGKPRPIAELVAELAR